jgi:Lrp/AsnC family leucine-responsive transcriptional regulator
LQNRNHFAKNDKITVDFFYSEYYSSNGWIKRMIDEIDQAILNIIQQDARISNVEIARQVNLAPSAVLERLRKLEERGYVRGFFAELDARKLGFGLTAFVLVRTDDRHGETAETLARMPEVLEVHHVAGEDCYLLKVKTHDAEELGVLLREKIGDLEHVHSTKTTVVLQTVKETIALPLENCKQEFTGKRMRKKE